VSTLQTIVAKFRPASPNIALAFDEVERRLVAVETAVPAPVPTPTPTPAPTAGPLFGFCKDVAAPATAYSTREFQEMVACAGPETVARVDYWTNGTQGTVLPAADTAGVRNLLLVVGGEMHSVPDPATYAALAVKVAKERPTAILEWGNEPGIHSDPRRGLHEPHNDGVDGRGGTPVGREARPAAMVQRTRRRRGEGR
jgi:hypothetical protein